MRTTVDLPDALFKRVKYEAALRGMRLKEFIAQSLEKSLAGQRDDLKSRRVRLPLIRSSGGHPINLTREQVDAGIWECRRTTQDGLPTVSEASRLTS